MRACIFVYVFFLARAIGKHKLTRKCMHNILHSEQCAPACVYVFVCARAIGTTQLTRKCIIILHKCAHGYLCMCFFFFALTSKELFALNPSKLLSNKDNIQEGACTAFLNEFKYALGTYI